MTNNEYTHSDKQVRIKLFKNKSSLNKNVEERKIVYLQYRILFSPLFRVLLRPVCPLMIHYWLYFRDEYSLDSTLKTSIFIQEETNLSEMSNSDVC